VDPLGRQVLASAGQRVCHFGLRAVMTRGWVVLVRVSRTGHHDRWRLLLIQGARQRAENPFQAVFISESQNTGDSIPVQVELVGDFSFCLAPAGLGRRMAGLVDLC